MGACGARLTLALLAGSAALLAGGHPQLHADVRQDFRFAWLAGALFTGEDAQLPQAPFSPWHPEHAAALTSLLGGDAGEDAARALCRRLKLPDRVSFLCEGLEGVGRGDAEKLWTLASWAAAHHASGVDVAVAGVRALMARSGRKRRIRRALTAHFRVPQVADITNDLRERLISLVASQSGRAVVREWLQRAMSDPPADAVGCPDLHPLIQRLALGFDDAMESLAWNATQTLPAPAALLEASAARVLDEALAGLDGAGVRAVLERRREGLTLLHQAALAGAAAHVLVLRHHARRAEVESDALAARAKSRFGVHAGLTARELAASAGHCSAARELSSPDACPQRARGEPPPDASWSALPKVRSWPSTWTHAADWVLPQECDITSVAFSGSSKFREVLQNHSLLNRPLRITGVGASMAAEDPSVFSFASADRLMRRPWSKLRYEVGDIPYAANFRKETPVMMDLGEYVRAMNRSELGPSMYWFSEHEAKEQPHKKDDIAIVNREAGKRLERVRRALFAALELDIGAEEDQTVQFTMGPPLTGSPVHFHAAALNFAIMGGKRWALLPLDDGHWSHMPLRLWQGEKLPSGALECMQRPGDVIFVPRGFTHGTVNVANTIAVSWLLYKEAEVFGLTAGAG